MNLSKEEFSKLSPEAQEEFINSGGTILSGEVKEGNCLTVTNILNDESKNNFPDKSLETPVVYPSESSRSPISEDDALSPSSQESLSNLDPSVFQLEDPIELLMMFDDDISSGKVKLHPWQIQFMLDFADKRHVKEFPFQAEVRAANGSGKDKYIVAACIVWLCMCNKLAQGVGTNGSGDQLDNQTGRHITNLCNKINAKLEAIVWKCNYRHAVCVVTGSIIDLFATDEELKAEGYHPLEAGAKFAIFCSEAKGVTNNIHGALDRCNGATHRVNVSSPGAQVGRFYDNCMTAIPRRELADIKAIDPVAHIEYHITAMMCPHITPIEIKIMARNMPGGENGELYKSSVLAEFTFLGEMIVIPTSYIYRANKRTDAEWIKCDHNDAGVDLADGGDECVLKVRNGNKVIATVGFKFEDSQDTVKFLDEKFREHKLDNPNSRIKGDCGGLGKIILDQLRKMGWKNIVYCDNRAKSSRPRIYKNWNSQSWFHLANLLEHDPIILDNDPTTTKQLSTRKYKLVEGTVYQMKSKLEMRSEGIESPDRADATVLCFSDYKSDFKVQMPEVPPYKEEESKDAKVVGAFDLRSYAKDTRNRGMYRVNDGQEDFSSIEDEIAEYNQAIKQN